MNKTEELIGLPPTKEAVQSFMKTFECLKCGLCCTGEMFKSKGIHIYPEDIVVLSSALQISPKQFKKRYTYTYESKRLIPQPCPFYSIEDKKCTVYTYRPGVCQTYPLVPLNNELLGLSLECTKVHAMRGEE